MGAFIILTALRSGLYCVIVPFLDPTAICLPLGLQQNEVTSAAAGISFISTELPRNINPNYKGKEYIFKLPFSSYNPRDPSLLQAVKNDGIAGFQLISLTTVPGLEDNLIVFKVCTFCL